MKKKPVPVEIDLTLGEALALSLVFYVANWAVTGRRATRIDSTGRHDIAFGIARRLVNRGLLREAFETFGNGTRWTKYHITKLGERTVRAMERQRGWTEEWLREHYRERAA